MVPHVVIWCGILDTAAANQRRLQFVNLRSAGDRGFRLGCAGQIMRLRCRDPIRKHTDRGGTLVCDARSSEIGDAIAARVPAVALRSALILEEAGGAYLPHFRK